VKTFLRIFLVVGILCVLLVVIFFVSSKRSEQRAKDDFIKYCKVCDTIQYSDPHPQIVLCDFDSADISEISFYLLKSGQMTRDTLIRISGQRVHDETYIQLNLPYGEFHKTDTILMVTQSNYYFCLTGAHFLTNLHFGNFGYLGGFDCRPDGEYTVNGKKSSRYIKKSYGLRKNMTNG